MAAPTLAPEPQPAQRPLGGRTGEPEVVIAVRNLDVGFGSKTILEGLDLDVYRGEVMGFVGGSGTGKSVLTRAILGLIKKRAGSIKVFGKDVASLPANEYRALEQRWGVLFQHGALFSGLTVRQNIQVPMREYLKISPELMDELALLKTEMVGLPRDAADKYPAELSGGMIKRAALARALSLDPEILFLDEPTSGLDPIGAAEFDELIATLQKTLGLTVFMVTHDLDSLYSICDRVAALADRKVIAVGSVAQLLANDHPWLKSYFHGKRAQRMQPPDREAAAPPNAAPQPGDRADPAEDLHRPHASP